MRPRSERIGRNDFRQEGRDQLIPVQPLIDRDLDIAIELERPVVSVVDDLGEVDTGRDENPVEAAIGGIGG